MTKENILKVATKEFAIYGYNGLSMNNLATKLDVNKATIYYHYKDKKSLYQEVIKSLVTMKREETENIINSKIDPKEKFRKYIKLYSEAINEKPEIVPLTLREMANQGADVQDGVEKDFEDEIELLIIILKELNLKDKYKELDPYILKGMIFGTFNSYYTMQMSNLEMKKMKNFDKDKNKVLTYIDESLTDVLLDALCED
jgi:AcrR family transcriptional regulator